SFDIFVPAVSGHNPGEHHHPASPLIIQSVFTNATSRLISSGQWHGLPAFFRAAGYVDAFAPVMRMFFSFLNFTATFLKIIRNVVYMVPCDCMQNLFEVHIMNVDESRLEHDRYERAKKRVAEIRDFYQHLSIYLVFTVFLFIVDIITGDGWWFYWATLVW